MTPWRLPLLICCLLAASACRWQRPPATATAETDLDRRLAAARREVARRGPDRVLDGPQLRVGYEWEDRRRQGRVVLRQDLDGLDPLGHREELGAAAVTVAEAETEALQRRHAWRRLVLEDEAEHRLAAAKLLGRRLALRRAWLVDVERGVATGTHTRRQEQEAFIAVLELEQRRAAVAREADDLAAEAEAVPKAPRLPLLPGDLRGRTEEELLALAREANPALALARARSIEARRRSLAGGRDWTPRLDFVELSLERDDFPREVEQQALVEVEDLNRYLFDRAISGGSPDPLVRDNELARAATPDVRESRTDYALGVELGLTLGPVEPDLPRLQARSRLATLRVLALERLLLRRLTMRMRILERSERGLTAWREEILPRLAARRQALADLPPEPDRPPRAAADLMALEKHGLDLHRRRDRARLAVLELVCVDGLD